MKFIETQKPVWYHDMSYQNENMRQFAYIAKKGVILISTYTKQALAIVMITVALLAAFPFVKIHYGNQLTFSKEPGYYDSAFYLSILGGKGGTIHFTLDGSEPTINDPVFDGNKPLYIEDATNHPNVYSMRTDTSTGFLMDLIHKYSTDIPNYTAPDYPVDKCTVLRASLFDSAGNCLSSITGTYFVGFQEKKGYQDIYTISIVTSPENLFDNDIGIYVTGNTFKSFLEKEIDREDCLNRAYWWSSNYSNRGISWEREARITLFDNHRNTILSQNCGIRIKGGGSSGKLPKSISCYARETYDGNDRFDTNIFQTDACPHKIVLFAGGDDNQFKLKDCLVNTLVQDLEFATLDFIPCALFIDGEYWGMYYITEDYNADYIHDHYQVTHNNIVMIKEYELSEGNEGDWEQFDEMVSFIAEQDMTNGENYNKSCDLIDMESYIDYYATQIYIARCGDWPNSNFALWRARENDGSYYGDCKWRWMLFDVNSGGLSSSSLYNNTLVNVLEADTAFASLYQNEEFRRKFAERLLYIGRETFAPEKCNQFIDQYVKTMTDPLAASNMRFYMDDKSEEFEQYVTDMRTFFEKRYDVVWDFLVQDMGEEWLAENGIQK